jgi:D-serine deaminase-like pyridoxal phosphate-dependent protein
MHISEIETPAVVVDLDVMERNLCRLADYTRRHNLRLRPHTKTHKIPALAERQLELGAAGLTVAKVGEAEVMLKARPPGILVEYPVIGREKIERLAEVARHTRVTVAVDSVEAAEALSAAGTEFGILAEVDVGAARVGVQPGAPLRDLLRRITRLPNLYFEGLSFFQGHILSAQADGVLALERLSVLIEQILADIKQEGLQAQVVSGGNTPTAFLSHQIRGLNEIRSGTYIFNDRNTVFSGGCAWEDCAASLLVTVVSRAVNGQVIIDGGSKAFSSDAYWGPGGGFGHLLEAPQAVFRKMNEEHGFVDIRETGRSFPVGARLRVIPNHICPAVNLHDRVYTVRQDQVEQVWEVAARGKLQ